MSKSRQLADLLDSNGDVVAGALDNAPPSNDASALTTGTLDSARLPTSGVSASSLTTGTLPVDRVPYIGRRNLIINGAMQVAQRGTVTGVTSSSYGGSDRFELSLASAGTWTLSQSTTAPEGFSNSFKLDCTTAEASPLLLQLLHRFEGQNLQHLKKGTANALPLTLSFWIRSNKTGNIQVNFRDNDNDRMISSVVTINSADTFEHKIITIDGDTTGSLDNDNNGSFMVEWFLDSSSSTYTSGSTPTSWEAKSNADRGAGTTIALADSTANELYITGVQLEVGTVATPFEHRSYGEELALCQRYYERWARSTSLMVAIAHTFSTGASYGVVNYKTKRAEPDCTSSTGLWRMRVGGVGNNETTTTLTFANVGLDTARVLYGGNGTSAGVSGWIVANHDAYVEFEAEL